MATVQQMLEFFEEHTGHRFFPDPARFDDTLSNGATLRKAVDKFDKVIEALRDAWKCNHCAVYAKPQAGKNENLSREIPVSVYPKWREFQEWLQPSAAVATG